MKSHAKIFCAAMSLTVVTSGAFAESAKTFRQKMSGIEFGAGVPLVMPLTGYNVFVGYVNKDAGTWLGRRFGIRADFNIPADLKLSGTISGKSDNPKDGYVADAHGSIMGVDLKLSDFSDKKIEIDAFEDDRKQPIALPKNAADLSLKIKNQNMGLLIDFYPFADTWFFGGLRLTGGYYLGDFKISMNANINENIEYSYNVNSESASDGMVNVLRAQIEKGSKIGADFHWKYHGPYAGIGFDLGIWHGFKFFMDAGAVFAHAPKVTNANFHDKDLKLNGQYLIYKKLADNSLEEYSSGEMVPIIDGIATSPNVNNIVQNAVGTVVQTTLETYIANPKYGDTIDLIENSYGVDLSSIDYQSLGRDIVYFLNGVDEEGHAVAPADWINELIEGSGHESELADTIKEIRDEWSKQNEDITGGIQKDVNKAWEDYDKAKQDAIKEANDFLKDYGIFPIVKIGFMYRF